MPALILASTSRYRRELLGRLHLPFECVAPGVDEDAVAGEAPLVRALRLARTKAAAVAARHPGAVVIGSDQVAASGSLVLDKPGDAARAREQLAHLSGGFAQFHTACVVLGPGAADSGPIAAGLLEPGSMGAARPTRSSAEHVDLTEVRFRTLAADEIARYVEQDHPLDCAGSFKSESLGIALFESLRTADPTALVGLPLIWLAGALRAAGYRVP